MQFLYDGDYYKVVKISGPKHNLLGIALGDASTLDVFPLPIKAGEIARIDEQDLVAQVLSGIDEINNELGCNYSLGKIQYVPSDTPSKSVYRELVQEVLRRAHQGGDFVRLDVNR